MSFVGKPNSEAAIAARKAEEEKRIAELAVMHHDLYMGYDSMEAAISDSKLTSQAEVLARLFSRENVFVSGLAGSGKTTVVNRFIKQLHLETNGAYNVAVTASTGIAATLLDGQTIHSWAGLGISTEPFNPKKPYASSPSKSAIENMKYTDVLIIDEISMLPAYLFTKLDAILKFHRKNKKPFGGVQLILLGDFLQLPPVVTESNADVDNRYAIETDAWKEADLKYCFLDKTHRSTDARLKRILVEISTGNISDRSRDLIDSRRGMKPNPDKAYATLYTTNRNVDAHNAQELAKNPNEKKRFPIILEGDMEIATKLMKQHKVSDVIEFKIGATVMLTKNTQTIGGTLANGSIGKIISWRDGTPVVKFNSGAILNVERTVIHSKEEKKPALRPDGTKYNKKEIVASVVQIPLKLAYAITVHKSQGQSFDGVIASLDKCFVPGLGYVALSRARSLDDLIISGFSDKAYKVGEKSLVISNFVRRKAVVARKKLQEDIGMYESALSNPLDRLAVWPEEDGGALRKRKDLGY